jgi:hypothetical protein
MVGGEVLECTYTVSLLRIFCVMQIYGLVVTISYDQPITVLQMIPAARKM